jgi:uncharacterized membrane protein
LTQQLVYPLLLSSLLAAAIFLGRVYISHKFSHINLMWNLSLAWVPYLGSIWVALLQMRPKARWWYFLAPCVLWLVFFPNAAYLITDLYNLDDSRVPLWYDIGLFFTCAWTGCWLAIASLNTMHALVRKALGGAASWLFVLTIVALNAIGLYLGRFLRWNSWDIFFHPVAILNEVVTLMFHPTAYRETLAFTGLFAAFLLVGYVTFLSLQHRSTLEKR